MAKLTNPQQAAQMLDAANGKASAWTVEEHHLPGIIQAAEAMLESRGLAKMYHDGAMLRYRPDGPAAKAYKRQVAGTEINLARVKSGWKMLSARRCWIWPGEKAVLVLQVTPLQRQIMHELIDNEFRLIEQESVDDAS